MVVIDCCRRVQYLQPSIKIILGVISESDKNMKVFLHGKIYVVESLTHSDILDLDLSSGLITSLLFQTKEFVRSVYLRNLTVNIKFIVLKSKIQSK